MPTTLTLHTAIADSWARVAPFWPLKNLIAANPLAGFEHLPFEEALRQGVAYYQQEDLPAPILAVNRATIKWLQAFLDEGQATIKMPGRRAGLFQAIKALLVYDAKVVRTRQHRAWVKALPAAPEEVIGVCLQKLGIAEEEQTAFLTLMLTTLPGWAAHIQYRTSWADTADARHPHPVSHADYLALRLVLTSLAWPDAKALLAWHAQALATADASLMLSQIERQEAAFRAELLAGLNHKQPTQTSAADAQLVFCIDVRSEPFRRALEAQGGYETLGFAGFFGLPVSIHDTITGESHPSCPVLLQPVCTVDMQPTGDAAEALAGQARKRSIKRLYQSLKYTFSTPFALVEALGAWSGLWMAGRTLAPALYANLDNAVNPGFDAEPSLATIPFETQCGFAAGALTGMGLTKNFAPLVVFCGHGSETRNNAYATALDCGACGGHHGAPNARLLAAILNRDAVRMALADRGIAIPDGTHFTAGEHNTTTDHLELHAASVPATHAAALERLRKDLATAQILNSACRAETMGGQPADTVATRALDWAQVRPEWGLARNAAFIVGPRTLTADLALQGRAFLHSYDWAQDAEGATLTAIMTAPMVVGQWINAQYLFSTLDNVAYGAGSKATQNITGKIGVMQGNASDLMHGLPLQSVYATDTEAYHEPVRLTTVVNAPVAMVDRVVKSQPVLRKLFGHGWVHLACLDATTGATYTLNRDLSWELQLAGAAVAEEMAALAYGMQPNALPSRT